MEAKGERVKGKGMVLVLKKASYTRMAEVVSPLDSFFNT
jgi:hypothetical protein